MNPGDRPEPSGGLAGETRPKCSFVQAEHRYPPALQSPFVDPGVYMGRISQSLGASMLEA